jgi:hypothetical protein
MGRSCTGFYPSTRVVNLINAKHNNAFKSILQTRENVKDFFAGMKRET